MKLFLTHPSAARLIAFDANELTPRLNAYVATHLSGCVRCQDAIRFVRSVSAAAEKLEVVAPPDALIARILHDRAAGDRVLLPSAAQELPVRPTRRSIVTKVGVAAAIALVLTLSVRPEGLSAASGRLVHNIVHRVGVLRSLVDADHAGPSSAIRTLATPKSVVIPVFAMDAVEAEANERHKTVNQVKVFSNGRVLINDVMGRTLRLYDSTLASSTLIAGPDSGTFKYGSQAAIVVPYWGDSVLFLDLASTAFLVLDAKGAIVRTIALPTGSDGMGILTGQPMLDPRGRLYYRVPVVPPDASPNPRLRLYFPYVDSCAVVRADFESRTLDTIAYVASGGTTRVARTLPSGRLVQHSIHNPAPVHDDWTVLADGTVAILRGSDYHIDWIRPDGSRAASAKLPFDWRKLDDAAKQRLLDSAQTATEKALIRARPSTTTADLLDAFELVAADRLPDYFPPIQVGSRRSDLDGDLWVPPTTTRYPTNGGLIYDEVDQRGTIARRVLLKPGYSIAGFGPDGAVYMVAADSAGFRLARARVARAPLSSK